MHVSMMHVSMIWCMYPWCIYPWSLILIHARMMHKSMFSILDPGPDTCMCDAFINVPQSLTLMHVCMMHISMILYPWSWYMHVWCIYLCSSILDYDACVYDAHIYDPGPWSWSMHVCMILDPDVCMHVRCICSWSWYMWPWCMYACMYDSWLWCMYACATEHSEKHFFNLETRMRISPIQSRTSRRDENLWHLISGFETRPRKMSFNLRHRDEIEIYYLQSQTSRRERESRLRQFSREFTRIWFVACAWTDIFQKKTFNFLIFLKIIHLLLLRNYNENLVFRDENEKFFLSISCFETRTRISFFQSRVSRREREIENHFSWSSEKKSSWFSREFPGSRILAMLCFSLLWTNVSKVTSL